MSSLLKRVLTGVALLLIVIASYYFFSIEGIRYLAILVFGIAVYEVYKTIKIKKNKASITTPIFCFLLLAVAFFARDLTYLSWVVFVFGLCAILWAQRSEDNISSLIENYFIEIILFLFVGGFGSLCLYGLAGNALVEVGFQSNAKTSPNFLIILFLSSFGCDVGAYFAGVTLGKKLFFPQISPKKTWAGFLGGLIVAVVSSLAYFKLVQLDSNIFLFSAFVLLAAIASIYGDLLMSLVKRSSGIKDFGSLFPGHGGVLDRIDGLLMASPIIYILVYYI